MRSLTANGDRARRQIVLAEPLNWEAMKNFRSDGEIINLLIAWYHVWWTISFFVHESASLGPGWALWTFTLFLIHGAAFMRSTLAYVQYVAYSMSASWFAFMGVFNAAALHEINASPLYIGWAVICLLMLLRRSAPTRQRGPSSSE